MYVTVEFDSDEFKIQTNGTIYVIVRGDLDVVSNTETVYKELSNENMI